MTVEQATALERSKVVRRLRAAIKPDLKHGRVSARELLLDPPDWLHGMRVGDFVAACPKVGPVKASRIVREAGLMPADKVGKISLVDACFLLSLLP